MPKIQPISSWSLPSEAEIKTIQTEANRMRARYLQGLIRKVFGQRA